MITIAILGFILVGLAQAESSVIKFNNETFQIHMHETAPITFTILGNKNDLSKVRLNATSSDKNVATVDAPKFEVNPINETITGSVNVSGIFLGSARLEITLNNGKEMISNGTDIIVIREQRLIDTIFTISVATFVSILYINFGCAMDWGICHKTLRRPVGPLIGVFCQFIFMPLISYMLAILLFPNNPEMQLGIFFTGISPSGGASNIWSILLGGNLNLSVTMTTLCTLAAFGMMPLWLFTLGRRIFEKAKLVMPYGKIATFAIGLVIPLIIGYFIQKKLPRLSRIMVRILKPFSIILVIFIIIFAIVTNVYLFKLFSWKIILAGLGLPWLGFIIGLIVAIVLRQPTADVRAIAIETGIQNTGIAIFLLRFSLKQPAADLTTVAPVSIAIMTPVPLAILYIVKLVLDRRKKNLAASREKLQNPTQPVATISAATSLTTPTQVTQ